MRIILSLYIPLILSQPIRAQDVMSGSEPGTPPILFNGDAVVLEAGELRRDMSCTVTPQKALLGFDLKFHSGYAVAMPLRDLEGSGNNLSIVFRITPKGGKDEPVYFIQKIKVPAVEDRSKGEVKLDGNFDIGEGSYHVDWLMRDQSGRFCSAFWDFEATLGSKDRSVAVGLPPHTIRRAEEEQFQSEPPVERAQNEAPLDVKVLMNFAPQRSGAATLDPLDTMALVSILRNISRNPRIGKFSLVAFNIQEQREFYRQEYSDHIDFPALGEALKQLSPGTVDMSVLSRKHGDTEFLSTLLKTETTAGGAPPDALIFVGPKTLLEANVPQDDLKEVGDLQYPVFYMNFNPDPQGVPWKDAISRLVKFFKGREYTISGPRDLWNSVTEMVARAAKAKQTRGSGAVATGSADMLQR